MAWNVEPGFSEIWRRSLLRISTLNSAHVHRAPFPTLLRRSRRCDLFGDIQDPMVDMTLLDTPYLHKLNHPIMGRLGSINKINIRGRHSVLRSHASNLCSAMWRTYSFSGRTINPDSLEFKPFIRSGELRRMVWRRQIRRVGATNDLIMLPFPSTANATSSSHMLLSGRFFGCRPPDETIRTASGFDDRYYILHSPEYAIYLYCNMYYVIKNFLLLQDNVSQHSETALVQQPFAFLGREERTQQSF